MVDDLFVENIVARLLGKTKCRNPQCRYENNNSYNYCVKFGWLLPGRSKTVVINSNEYEDLKKKANMLVWEKLRIMLHNKIIWHELVVNVIILIRAVRIIV